MQNFLSLVESCNKANIFHGLVEYERNSLLSVAAALSALQPILLSE